MKEREKFSTRLGFLLISAGCAIGLGNVWRFPYITGKYGGGAFVLIYLFFLIVLGLPVMVMEFSVGRASQRSVATSFNVLEPKGSKWHLHRYTAMAGNYILMMCYTTIAGWMLAYVVKMAKGDFVGKDTAAVGQIFNDLQLNTGQSVFWMLATIVIGLFVCSLGLEKGVEKITKVMMVSLIALMLALVIRAVTLPGAADGLRFYLIPNMKGMEEMGIRDTIMAAMGQSFFTLSTGIGSLAIFGSYIGKDHSLTGEAVNVLLLDTFVAVVAGLIIFPACFAFGVNPGEGPGLVFVTLPNIFNEMAGGRLWGTLFFLFMSFAALSTVIAVFQNILSFGMDLWGWSLKKAVVINAIALPILCLPCALGLSVWSDITILGRSIMDFEDFTVSSVLLPLGSLIYLLFCVTRYGWGWDNFIKEANAGKGIKVPKGCRFYLTFVLPVLILVIFLSSLF